VHNLRRRALSRRREGISSMLTGHSFSTASQSSFPFSGSRRKIIASSSASNRASKYSPGDAGAKAAGTVKRRLESSLTIMVGLSHHLPAGQSLPDRDQKVRLCDFVTSYVSLVSFVLTPGINENSADADPALGRRPEPQLILYMSKGKVQKMCAMGVVPQWAKPIIAAAIEMST